MKAINLSRFAVSVLALTGIVNQVDAANATIDVKTWHQKITGFGCATAWSGTMTETEADQLWDTVKGAGLSLNRMLIDRDGLGTDETNNAVSATKRGAKPWGTPWFCKNGVNKGDYDTLYEKDYQEWADVLADMAIKMKAMGAPIYAISSGNEIDLGWTKFSAEALSVYVSKYLGPTLKAKAPDTKLIGIEPCNWYGFDHYYNYFKNNAEAWKYSDILATHEYGGSPKAYPDIHKAGKEFWQTEIFDPQTDVEDVGMPSALRVCKLIHEALTIANMNAWHYWWKNPCNNCANGALWSQSPKAATKRLWIMGNWSRYARPGFIRVEAPTEPTSGVFVTAFRDSALSKVVIVAFNNNNNAVPQIFSIPGVTAKTVTVAITDPSRDLVEEAPQAIPPGDFTYSLPSQSVTTLVFNMGEPVSAYRDSVTNGGFDRGESGWTFNTWGGVANGSVIDGEYQIQIDNLGDANSSIQLVQNGIILREGSSYEVKFDAHASVGRTLEANVELDISPWTSYLPSPKSFDLTTTKTPFSYTFTMTNPTDSNGRISFNAGASTETVYLDNISIKEVPTGVRTRGVSLAMGLRWSEGALLLPGTESGKLQIVDSRGHSRIVDVVGSRVDVGHLPAGLYQARVLGVKPAGFQKFIVLP